MAARAVAEAGSTAGGMGAAQAASNSGRARVGRARRTMRKPIAADVNRRFAAQAGRGYTPRLLPTRGYCGLSDIFDEIDQEMRADRAKRLLQRYGGVMIAAVVVVLIAVGGWQAWKAWDARQRSDIANIYLTASQQADSQDAATRAKAVPELRQVIARGSEGYRTLARLRLAAVLAPTDAKEAVTLWDQVAADHNADPLLRDTATLAWGQHVLDTGNPGVVRARLAAIAQPGNALRPLAEESLALLDLREGKTADAKTKLKDLMNDTTVPAGVRGRATALLMQIGGS